MSNKKQLQLHNADLAMALDNINGLPMAEDVKHGIYAWKKYSALVYNDISFTARCDYSDYYKLVITYSDEYNLSVLGIAFLDGFYVPRQDDSAVYSTYDYSAGRLYFGSSIDSRDYYVSSFLTNMDKQLILTPNKNVISFANATGCKYDGEKLFNIQFRDYVTADIMSRYPDDGMQDGFYYKRLKDMSLGRFEKYDSGSFTVTANTDPFRFEINHNLGVVPKYVFVYADMQASDIKPYVRVVISETFENMSDSLPCYIMYNAAYGSSVGGTPNRQYGTCSEYAKDALSHTTIRLGAPYNIAGSMATMPDTFLLGGIIYNWIAMA